MGDTQAASTPKIERILIDFENVEKSIAPDDFQGLPEKSFHVTVFCGPTQKRLSIEILEELQRIGGKVNFVKVKRAGKNALDLHVAYYLARFLHEEPRGSFHIIAEDGGYASLVEHLRASGLCVQNHRSVGAIALQNADEGRKRKLLRDAVAFLSGMPSPPGTIEELHAKLRARFHLGKKMLLELMRLFGSQLRVNEDGKVEYCLQQPKR